MAQELVTQYQIAERLEVSVQTVRKWRLQERHPFPSPEVGGHFAIWRWAPVKRWAISTGRLSRSGEVLRPVGGRPT